MSENKEFWYELSVKNFKNIINKTQEYRPLSENGSIIFWQNKLNIIVGKNNTGKTNILKAIIYSQNITDINKKYSNYIGDIAPSTLSTDLRNEHTDIDVSLKMNFSDHMKNEIKDGPLKELLKSKNNLYIFR